MKKVAVAVFGAIVLAAAAVAGFSALRWADRSLLNEQLKDWWGQIRYAEDWSSSAALPKLDYTWLDTASRPILVAHALGEAGLAGQNTLGALQRSVERGLRLLEVDIWLDKAGRLRCHHGPTPPTDYVPGDCQLPEALRAAAQAQAWLVLDVKTDFEETGEAIVRQLQGDPTAIKRLIFQLYKPSDIPLFTAWATRLDLPGPIVTAHRARRSLQHVAQHTSRLGIRVLTFPLHRSDALGKRPPGLVLLVHPVHDCPAAAEASRVPADGMYLLSTVSLLKGCGA